VSSFEFRETMAGSYHLLSSPHDELPLSFTIRARSRRLSAFVRRPVVDIEGEVDAQGLADHRMLRGTLGMDLLRTGRLSYAFRFTSNEGAELAFEGEKIVRLGDFVASMTVLPGSILETRSEGEPRTIARALLRFDLRQRLLPFLRSWQLVA
jgi:hypothetical protein